MKVYRSKDNKVSKFIHNDRSETCIKTVDSARYEKEDFTQACQAEGKTASDVLREFMRAYVEEQPARLQRPLFDQEHRTS